MRVFLAGDVAGAGDWRQSLVQPRGKKVAGLGHDADARDWSAIEPRFVGSLHGHDYVGPFFSLFSGPAGGLYGMPVPGDDASRSLLLGQLAGEARSAIARADLVFAWVDSPWPADLAVHLGLAAGLREVYGAPHIWVAGPAPFADCWPLYGLAERLDTRAASPGVALLRWLLPLELEGEAGDPADASYEAWMAHFDEAGPATPAFVKAALWATMREMAPSGPTDLLLCLHMRCESALAVRGAALPDAWAALLDALHTDYPGALRYAARALHLARGKT